MGGGLSACAWCGRRGSENPGRSAIVLSFLHGNGNNNILPCRYLSCLALLFRLMELEKIMKNLKVCVFGDSHSVYFGATPQLIHMKPEYNALDLKLEVIQGATVKGLGKRVATLNTLAKIDDSIHKYSPDIVVLAFGQVDVELGYYYVTVVKGEEISPESYIKSLTDTYLKFIQEKSQGKYLLVVKGINPPVLSFFKTKALTYTNRIITENIEDESEQRRLFESLKINFPDDTARLRNHLFFNTLIEEHAQRYGFDYYDINRYLIEPGTNHVKLSLIPSAFDHHIADTLEVRMQYLDGILNVAQSRGLL